MMRVYYLLEGENEIAIYREWTRYLKPNMKHIINVNETGSDCYYIFSARGFPCIYDDIKNAYKDCENYNYDLLLICLDLDDNHIENISDEIMKRIPNQNIKYKLIIQKRCIETWLLGNRKIFKRNPCETSNFYHFFSKFNALILDPEDMPTFDNSKTTSQYHYAYCKAMLGEKKIYYTKGKTPKEVYSKSYFTQLLNRIKKENHLRSLKEYINVFQ